MRVIHFDSAQWFIHVGDLVVPVQRVTYNWDAHGKASARPLRTEVVGVLVPDRSPADVTAEGDG